MHVLLDLYCSSTMTLVIPGMKKVRMRARRHMHKTQMVSLSTEFEGDEVAMT